MSCLKTLFVSAAISLSWWTRPYIRHPSPRSGTDRFRFLWARGKIVRMYLFPVITRRKGRQYRVESKYFLLQEQCSCGTQGAYPWEELKVMLTQGKNSGSCLPRGRTKGAYAGVQLRALSQGVEFRVLTQGVELRTCIACMHTYPVVELTTCILTG